MSAHSRETRGVNDMTPPEITPESGGMIEYECGTFYQQFQG